MSFLDHGVLRHDVRAVRVGQDIRRIVDRLVGKQLIVVAGVQMVFVGEYMVAAANDQAMVDELASRVAAYASRVTLLEVGPVIAAHTGTGTGGIGYHVD